VCCAREPPQWHEKLPSQRRPFCVVLTDLEYFGHDVRHLQRIHTQLRNGARSCIFLAGDSSLDNKVWLEERGEAVRLLGEPTHVQAFACNLSHQSTLCAPSQLNGYEQVLDPPLMKKDVCYWLNWEARQRGLEAEVFSLNTAVEATSLNSRAFCSLLAQDKFIHVRLTSMQVR
jgi:hypothetical protein